MTMIDLTLTAVRSRRELCALDDRELWDMGLTRMEADNEANKPFWEA